MAVDVCAMHESLRWESADPGAHLAELARYGEYCQEHSEPPEPALRVLGALGLLMDFAGDARQIVTRITGMRHADDQRCPAHFQRFLERLRSRSCADLSPGERARFCGELVRPTAWPKFDEARWEHLSGAAAPPLSSYDVLKCSQALFHLFEWLRGLLPEAERPPRQVPSDLGAFRRREAELRRSGPWPEPSSSEGEEGQVDGEA
eukprot:CAMPEP_0175567944 /NCGR_PEP_ID=MMETSP0096-20121207/40718_1 /TAXON_ID=311494 /ORGANISM="Alexandrium monilatum, Strain CCMP3105" /LENGTH=204 /DNA_ID=CAMNT_0016871273 /DNA_START=21 /DNA_END=635 /DNA_ORIENTATION=+